MIMKYANQTNPKKSARSYGKNMRISTKSSVTLCKAINGLRVDKAEGLLKGLVEGKRDLHGKYYTKTAHNILDILVSAKSNAESKGLEVESMVVKASAHKGFRLWTPRRFKLARTAAKNTSIQMVLEAR